MRCFDASKSLRHQKFISCSNGLDFLIVIAFGFLFSVSSSKCLRCFHLFINFIQSQFGFCSFDHSTIYQDYDKIFDSAAWYNNNLWSKIDIILCRCQYQLPKIEEILTSLNEILPYFLSTNFSIWFYFLQTWFINLFIN